MTGDGLETKRNSLDRSGRRHQRRESVARQSFRRKSGLVSAVAGKAGGSLMMKVIER